MRSRQEILFRLRQEVRNLRLWMRPPGPVIAPNPPLPILPVPEKIAALLRGTPWAAKVIRLAEAVCVHQFPLFDRFVETGPEIEWRRDYLAGISSPLRYFRRVPYLDAARVGDHKNVWELNRHQHLVLLAQAHLVSGRAEFLAELWDQLESWLEQNPYGEGINWASALEVAFRALSWTWVYHLAGAAMPPELRPRFLTMLYRHGLFLENNFSIYFSPNTHLVGEAVALHALGVLFPAWDRAARWREYGCETVVRELHRQVQPDGMHFEQSTYYHVYALDMFLFHAVLAGMDSPYRERLVSMADLLAVLMGTRRSLAFLGDDDGGRLFHPYGPRDQFGRATLATASRLLQRNWMHAEEDTWDQTAWWLGPAVVPDVIDPLPQVSGPLPGSGLTIWNLPVGQIVLDGGSFGRGSAGHSHADALSIILSTPEEEILIDPGTYTYLGEPEWRERFRGSAMHNTLHVPEGEQATPAGPFRWRDLPLVAAERDPQDVVHGLCHTASGYQHVRRAVLIPPALFVILDLTTASEAVLSWHLGAACTMISPSCVRIGRQVHLISSVPFVISESWRSRVYASKEPVRVLQSIVTGPTATVIDFDGTVEAVTLAPVGQQFRVCLDGQRSVVL